MDFFTKNEFDLLNNTKGNYCDRQLPAMDSAYKELSAAYKKVEFWVSEIQKKIFPAGEYSITKKPTNQRSNFDGYLWSRLYPTKKDAEEKWLAITIGLNSDFCYNVKIDTVGLNKGIKYDYIKAKQDNNSTIVKLANQNDEKIQDWQGLMDFTIEAINSFIKEYAPIKLHFSESNNVVISETVNSIKYPLNQILYGPPGTGKTYYTKELAVKIADPAFNELEFESNQARRAEVVKRYDMLYKEGQIAFSTFHQSFTYEDFIEGIKPLKPDPWTNRVLYDVVDGTFKLLCTKASEHKESFNFDDAYSKFLDEVVANSNLTLETPTHKKPFNLKINRNDTAVAIPQTDKATEMGITKSMVKEYVINGIIRDWKPYTTAIGDYIKKKYEVTVEDVDNSKKSYVLIIDEINRGNVSSIFGELITLLESEKRKGNDEEISVQLPYSKHPFSIPSNIYIIGTMNTADRSVEALDTALRRRFSFTEIMPQPRLLSEIDFEDFTLEEVLTTINERVELLLDRDHTIGHSYFIKISSGDERALKAAFKNCIIPLLQEYFYHDYEKIALILGEGFVTVKDTKPVTFAKVSNVDINRPDTIARFELIEEVTDIKKAIQLLLNKDA